MERYGFFLTGLKEKFWWWDILTMYKKFGVIFAVEYLRIISNKMQTLICIVLVIVFILVTIRIKPYKEQSDNDLSIRSETIQLIILYFGCISQTNYQEDFIRDEQGFFQWIVALGIAIPSI
jgi:hypothetical protein